MKSTVYTVSANGAPLFVEDFKDVHYTHFSFDGEVEILVTVQEPVEKFNISPHHFEIEGMASENHLRFSLSRPRKLAISINNKERLFIFADSIDRKAPKTGDTEVANILDFGVDNTGTGLQTDKIQAAMDATAADEGILYFPPGIYLTGTLSLKSNLTVYLAGGAVIQGSSNREDYPVDPGWKESDMKNDPENWSNKGEKMTYSRLLLVDNAGNVKVFGRGIIDGDGKTIRDQGKPANLIRIRNSRNVLFEGLILRDPAAWNTHILYSENVTFCNIKMINDRTVKNTDGINPDASRQITIDDCFLYCSDDNIAVKTSRNSGLLQNAEDIIVKNCVFLTKKSAMKLGTETFAEYQRRITFENNDVVEADRAMTLYCMDGAKFEDIRWINCRVESFFPDNQQKMMHFRVRDRDGKSAGHIRNVLIKDCRFEKRSPKDPLFTGWDEDHQISNVHFENLVINGQSCDSIEDIGLKTNEFVTGVTVSVE